MEKRPAIWDFDKMRVSVPITEKMKEEYYRLNKNVIWTFSIRRKEVGT